MNKEEFRSKINEFLLDLRDSEIAESSLKVYETNLDMFLRYLDGNKVEKITKEAYIDYRDHMKLRYKTSTINKYIVIINKYFAYLGREDLKIKQVKYQKQHYLQNVPDVKDYKRILRAAKKYNELYYYMIQIISYTGIRITACCNIKVEDLKESKKNNNYLKIVSKGKQNEIPVPQWLRREVLNYCKKAGIESGYIFSYKGKPLSRITAYNKIHKITGLARVSLKKGHPHAFRHLFGKEYIKYCKNDYQTVSDILGHNSTKTSEIYTQKSQEEISKYLNDFRIGKE